ncbi:hypothetical protein HPB51_014033 [Rhipicephalus microplus]|uniref:Uncharacterized protein n=1 Tax=Rhipicephalus microplus TaxID=6941 RepID=A0A9J6DA77_RHIMP|nr:hypothetical protein HPB51_014033 [Rhipicephalus microplus]
MTAGMDINEFPILGTAPATGQAQRRMTTLCQLKRLNPSDTEEWPEPPVIPEKTPARAITEPQAQQAGSQVDVARPMSIRCDKRMEEEGSNAELSQATATELERAADSGEEGKQGENDARSASGDDEAEDDAASAPRRARNVVGQKKGDNEPHGRDALQTAYDKHLSSSAKQEKSVKALEDAPKHPELFISSRQQSLPEPAQQRDGTSQQRAWEGAKHGEAG